MAILSAGAMLILLFYLKGLIGLVDLATVLSFATAPFLGILTYRAVTAAWVPEDHRPGPALRMFAILGIAFLGAFLLFFVYTKIG
jgi:hypothetical protein